MCFWVAMRQVCRFRRLLKRPKRWRGCQLQLLASRIPPNLASTCLPVPPPLPRHSPALPSKLDRVDRRRRSRRRRGCSRVRRRWGLERGGDAEEVLVQAPPYLLSLPLKALYLQISAAKVKKSVGICLIRGPNRLCQQCLRGQIVVLIKRSRKPREKEGGGGRIKAVWVCSCRKVELISTWKVCLVPRRCFLRLSKQLWVWNQWTRFCRRSQVVWFLLWVNWDLKQIIPGTKHCFSVLARSSRRMLFRRTKKKLTRSLMNLTTRNSLWTKYEVES